MIHQNLMIPLEMLDESIWAFCNRKGGNCREKPILHLYAKYDSWAEICPEIVLTQKKNFPAVSPLFIAKGPYRQVVQCIVSLKMAINYVCFIYRFNTCSLRI